MRGNGASHRINVAMLIKLAVGLLLGLDSFTAIAQQSHVDIEQRLTAEQWHATGLDTLSPAQLELLNRLLREASAKTATLEPSSRAEGLREYSCGRSYIGLEDKPISC